MTTISRQKILNYLKRNRAASALEVARALRMTPANARHHLGILAADGRVEAVSQRKGGKGRPEKVYHLSDALVGDNLAVLLDLLLDAIPPEEKATILAEIGGKNLLGITSLAGQPLMRRLAVAMDRLNVLHYQARWEAGAEGPRVILGHCPYAAVIGKHPEICRMDAALLQALLGGNVRQTAKLEAGAGGVPYCVFALIS